MDLLATIKGRRITGGAIVTVTRQDGRVHRHKVGLRRFNRLKDVLVVHRHTRGAFLNGGMDCDLYSLADLAEAYRWAARNGRQSRNRHWK